MAGLPEPPDPPDEGDVPGRLDEPPNELDELEPDGIEAVRLPPPAKKMPP
jgi:hypothetical protein